MPVTARLENRDGCPAHQVACPGCGAEAGQLCRTDYGYRTPRVHWKRMWAAEKAGIELANEAPGSRP